MEKVWLGAILWLTILALGEIRAADDFDGKVPAPPGNFTGTPPVDNGSLVPLKDGRLMMVGSGTRVSYSKDGGRTWTSSQPLAVEGKPLAGDGHPTSLIRLKSGKLALLYGREATPSAPRPAMTFSSAPATTREEPGPRRNRSTCWM